MYGVVLWSDQVDGKAVIWCEDHGDLAYFSRALDGDAMPDLDAGDMVQFDLRQETRIRRATNPRLVVNQHCAGLADGLSQAAPLQARGPSVAQPTVMTAARAQGPVGAVAGTVSGSVISFAQAAQRRLAGRLTLA